MNTERIAREFPWVRPPARPFLSPRAFGGIALGVALFTVYGSLVPFQYRWRPFDDALHGFRWVIENRFGVQSRSDFLANVLLGVPLGFALSAWWLLDSRPSWFRRALRCVLIWLACTAFASVVEFLQLYFPNRTCSASDILAQSLGAAVGALGFLLAGQRMIDWLRVQFDGDAMRSPAVAWLALYVAVLALVQWLPLDLSASPADWVRKVREGKVTLSPFSELDARPDLPTWRKLQVWLELAAVYLPAGLLLAFAPFAAPVRTPGVPSWRPVARAASRALGFGLILAAILEAGQWPVLSRSPSTSDVLIGGAAVLLGWMIARGMGVNAAGGGLDIEAALILGQAWLLWLAIAAWLPFEFDGAIGGDRFRELNWLPFAAAQEKNYLSGLEEALAKAMQSLPYGAIVASVGAAGRARARRRIGLGAALAVGLALLLEAGQLFIPVRVASPSDIMAAALGGAVGAAATLRLRGQTPAARESAPLATTPPPMAKLQVDDPRRVIR